MAIFGSGPMFAGAAGSASGDVGSLLMQLKAAEQQDDINAIVAKLKDASNDFEDVHDDTETARKALESEITTLSGLAAAATGDIAPLRNSIVKCLGYVVTIAKAVEEGFEELQDASDK